jgi:hypothetical protein
MMAPRAVIEYVESHEFPKLKIAGSSREEKWENFFSNDEIGRRLLGCLCARNKGWEQSPKKVGRRLQGLYQYSSDYHHSTSLEINDTRNISIPKLNSTLVIQTLNVIHCIAEHFQLQITS